MYTPLCTNTADFPMYTTACTVYDDVYTDTFVLCTRRVTCSLRLAAMAGCIATCYDMDVVKYLGIQISQDLQWDKHIDCITSKAK